MGNVWYIIIRFKFNFFSYYIMEHFVKEVQKAFPNIDEDILKDYFMFGYTADEFIKRETELQNEDAEMEEQYKKDRASWV